MDALRGFDRNGLDSGYFDFVPPPLIAAGGGLAILKKKKQDVLDLYSILLTGTMITYSRSSAPIFLRVILRHQNDLAYLLMPVSYETIPIAYMNIQKDVSIN